MKHDQQTWRSTYHEAISGLHVSIIVYVFCATRQEINCKKKSDNNFCFAYWSRCCSTVTAKTSTVLPSTALQSPKIQQLIRTYAKCTTPLRNPLKSAKRRLRKAMKPFNQRSRKHGTFSTCQISQDLLGERLEHSMMDLPSSGFLQHSSFCAFRLMQRRRPWWNKSTWCFVISENYIISLMVRWQGTQFYDSKMSSSQNDRGIRCLSRFLAQK